LKGDVCKPDYDFLDPRLDDFYKEISHIIDVTGWTHGLRALSPQLNVAWNEVAIMEHLFPNVPGLKAYKDTLREVTRDSNEALFRIIEDTADVFSGQSIRHGSAEELRSQCEGFADRLLSSRHTFLLSIQELLLEALERDGQAVFA
jgi:hypothetical protein